ncbi:MAG: lysophospholipid acyltransferase family protein [Chloroflexota bacterium]|nr:lysophospholipid acyltransferase family protein [Chloroflexota bacterium]
MTNPNTLTTDPREQKRYYFQETRTRRVTVAMLRTFAWFTMRFDARGVEYLPAEGPVVMVCNHVTNFDVFAMQLSIPRPLFYMAKEELHRNPITDYILRKGGAFPVYRGSKDQWAIRHAEKVLEHGQVLGLFPESTRSGGRGLRTAKTGAARFAQKIDCPIVPMAIDGSQRVFENFPRRTRITINIGEPILPRPGEGPLALTDRMMFAIANMLPEELRGVYAERPPGFDD